MNKLTKGALAMVLAGSVTFSIANSLLVHQSSKQLVEENALTISKDPKNTDVFNQGEKIEKDQTPTTNVKNVQTKPSDNIATLQAALGNKNKSDITVANFANTSTTTTTMPATSAKAPTTTPTTTGANTTSAKAPIATTAPTTSSNTTSTKAPTTTTIPTTTGTNPTSATKTTTNHGQEVALLVKEKGQSSLDKRENNGKEM